MSHAPAQGRIDVDAALNLDLPQLYLDRELSWLAFNARVLDQASDASWPLLERVKFLAIFAANLDEFFMIRVSGLHDQRETELSQSPSIASGAGEQLVRIRAVVGELCDRAAELFLGQLLPELEARGIRLRRFASLDSEQRIWAREYFRSQVFPVLTPLAVDPVHPFPFVSNLSLSLAIEAEDPTTGARRFARLKVPESLERLLALPNPGQARSEAEGPLDFLPLEELIAANLSDLFPGMRVVGSWPFRVTRDMDIDILEEEAADLLSVVDREVRKRRFGAPVRLELSPAAPEHVRTLLLEKLELDAGDLYGRGEMLGLSSLFSLARLGQKELRDPPLRQALPQAWDDDEVFSSIRAHDYLLHHPYESFTPVLDLLRAAAADPNVLAIKMTLYRAGSNSEAVQALIRAAENGKQVAVSVELKARFDEEANIGWARALERAGAHVFYGASGLKTHAKALLVVRREADGLRRYVHLSTGNYNAATAKLYTDLGLLTTDEALGEDVTELFNTLSGFARDVTYRKLAVAPATLRGAIVAKIRAQKERAARGEPAQIFAKLNSLVDSQIIRELYAASGAGVRIELLVRGICCLRPGLPKISENIRVYSLVGRFLEHERVYVFGPPEDAEYYLSSADWMPRNLDRRVEVLFPVSDERLRERVRKEVLEPFRADDCRVYEMDRDGNYRRRQPRHADAPVDGQVFAYERVSELAARAPESSVPEANAQPLALVSG
jgi:polyphosphate kinase